MSKLINDPAHYEMIADLANTLLSRANLLTNKGNGADARERATLVREAVQLAARCPYPIVTTGLLALVVRLQSAASE